MHMSLSIFVGMCCLSRYLKPNLPKNSSKNINDNLLHSNRDLLGELTDHLKYSQYLHKLSRVKSFH